MSEEASKLVKDMSYIPTIIGAMGSNIAEAQTKLNTEYLRALTYIVLLLGKMESAEPATGEDAAEVEKSKSDSIKLMLEALAPSLYQFTNSTLEFRADFSQTSNTAINAGIGGGLFGFTISAGFSRAFGYDYQAAGKITTVLQALRPSETQTAALLDRSKAIAENDLKLPPVKAVDAELIKQAAEAFKALTKKEPVKADDAKTEP